METPTVNCPSQEKEETSKPYKTCRKAYRKENTTCEWDDGGKIGKWSNWNLAISAWNMIFKTMDGSQCIYPREDEGTALQHTYVSQITAKIKSNKSK